MKPLTEEQMWDIIDGIATPDVKAQHDLLLKSDAVYKADFDKLMHLQMQLLKLDLEEPSMRFTQNILDKVTPSVKTVVKPDKVVRGFLLGMGILACAIIGFTVVMGGGQGNTPATGVASFFQNTFSSDKIFSGLYSSSLFPIFMLINTFLLYMIVDKWVVKNYLQKR